MIDFPDNRHACVTHDVAELKRTRRTDTFTLSRNTFEFTHTRITLTHAGTNVRNVFSSHYSQACVDKLTRKIYYLTVLYVPGGNSSVDSTPDVRKKNRRREENQRV